MAKIRLKLGLWAAIVLLLLLAAWMALRAVGALTLYTQQGADPASALNIVPNVPPDLHVRVSWLQDDRDTGRPMEPYARQDIQAAYLRAWLQWNLSELKGQAYGLQTYFVGPALAALDDTIGAAARQRLVVEQADLSHVLRLHVYSADGSIVSFTDGPVHVAQLLRDRSGSVVFAGETAASYDVVMFLEDGSWRVRHLVRSSGAVLDASSAAPALPAPRGFVTRSGAALTLDGAPYHIAGVDYYPEATPWGLFWDRYSPRTTDIDFARIHDLGLNTIRIFVPFAQFGGANVDSRMADRMADLLARADRHGLKVIVTLFDFRADYGLLHWPDADRQLQALLTRFATDPAILAWDLKNEPDLDYAAAGRERVDAWLAHTIRLARGYDPHHLLTIGWSTPAAAATLGEGLDLVTFHYFQAAAALPGAYARVSAAVRDRPIALTEFGLPTWNSIFPHGHTEPEQAQYYAEVLASLRGTASAGYLAWTLYDFGQVPATVAGRWPWRTGPQANLGILHQDGTPKAAAALLAPGASLSVTRVPGWSRFLKPFWLLVFGGLISCAALAARLVRARILRHRPAVSGNREDLIC